MTFRYLNKFLVEIHSIKSLLCSRQIWVVFVPVLFYLSLLSVTSFLSVPLRSVNVVKSAYLSEESGGNNPSVDIYSPYHPSSAEVDKVEPYTVLEEIFHKADSNNDGHLNAEEVSAWINTKIQEHIHNAVLENYNLFTAIDVQPRDGIISWDEYHSFYLIKHGLSKHYIMNHNERHRELSRELKEAIMRDKAAWSEVARSDPEHLTLDEFLAFQHPESSYTIILSLVEDLFDKFDRDADEILTEDEFSSLDISNEKEKSEIQSQGEMERRREFREVIDQNNDGKATRKELLFYIDPKNPRHAKEEAETLVVLADMDHDGRLSLLEVFNKMDLFLGSKMVDTARSFHDEF